MLHSLGHNSRVVKVLVFTERVHILHILAAFFFHQIFMLSYYQANVNERKPD